MVLGGRDQALVPADEVGAGRGFEVLGNGDHPGTGGEFAQALGGAMRGIARRG